MKSRKKVGKQENLPEDIEQQLKKLLETSKTKSEAYKKILKSLNIHKNKG